MSRGLSTAGFAAGRTGRRTTAFIAAAVLVFGTFALIPSSARADAPVAAGDTYSLPQNQAFTAGWWDASWSHRARITLDNSGQNENLDNFPVLVTIDGATVDYDFTADAAEDLRFLDGDGTLLAHEVARWDEAGTSLIWVKVPRIAASSDSDYLWLYYGNAAAPSVEQRASVWSNHYRTVYHLDEAGSEYTEASGQFGSGTNAGSSQAQGQVGNGRNFAGSSYIRLPNDQQYLNGVARATISAWVKPDSVSGIRSAFGVSIHGATSASRINVHIDDGAVGAFVRSADEENAEPGGRDLITSVKPVSAGSWQHLTVVVDYAADSATAYVNGVAYPMTGATSGKVDFRYDSTPNTNSDRAAIGANEDGASEFFAGSIDEIRLEDVGRSTAWIRAQYLSMTGTMASVGESEETSGPMGVIDNDEDADGDHLVASLVTPPEQAKSFTLNADGTFEYVPEPYFVGTDQFSYKVSDGTTWSEPASVGLDILQTNSWPALTVTGESELTEHTSLSMTLTATDPDGDELTFSASGAPDGFSVDPFSGIAAWKPTEEQGPGTFSFDVTVQDDGTPVMWDTVPVTIEVTEDNETPTVALAAEEITAEGRSLQLVASASDPDLPKNQLTLSASGLPSGLAFDPTSGTISGELDYAAAASSPYVIKVTATDDGHPAASASATLLLVVENTNRAPEASDASIEIAAGSSIEILLVASDPDGEALSYSVTSGPEVGTVTGSGPLVTYAVGPTTSTHDEIRFTADDGNLTSEGAVITVTIDPNVAPIAGDDGFVVDQARSLSVSPSGILGNDVDPDGDSLSVKLADEPRHGSVEFHQDGAFTYFHDGRSSVTDTFTYVVTDGVFFSERATVTIEVVPNALPESHADTAQIIEDSSATINVLANDRDPDGDSISLDSVVDPANGSAHVAGSSVVFVPDQDWNGDTEFEYVLSDDRGGSSIGRISVGVAPVNDPPSAANRTIYLKPDRSIEFNLASLVDDPDDTSLTYDAAAAQGGELVQLGPATFRYTPEDGFTGEVEIMYTATDPSGLVAQGLYLLVVDGVTAQAIAAPALVSPVDPTGPNDGVGVLGLTLAGVEVPGLALMFGAVFETVENLRLPLLILLVTFVASVLLGLPRRRPRKHRTDS